MVLSVVWGYSMSIKLAVGIPVYNDSVFIERSVQNCIDMGYDYVVYLDDGSTDDSFDRLVELTRGHSHIDILRRKENSVSSNSGNRWEIVAEQCRTVNPDWIMTRATDEVLSHNAKGVLREKIDALNSFGVNMVVFNYIHLWRSEWWYRVDSFWGGHHTICMWKNDTGWKFKFGSGIHLGAHRPNSLEVKNIVHNINGSDSKDIVVVHYGMSSHDLLARKLDYQISTSLKIGKRAAGMSITIPHPSGWQHINGYKAAYEENVNLEKVNQKWFSEPIPDVPAPEIKSLYKVVNKHSVRIADEYAKIYGR